MGKDIMLTEHEFKEIIKQFHRDKKNACEMDVDLTVDASIVTLFMGEGKEITYTFRLTGAVERLVVIEC